MWRQMWDAAAPLAAAEQEPLMDVELEGERVLHHMETAGPASILDQLLLVAAAAAPALLAACPAGAFPPAASRLARCALPTFLRRAVASINLRVFSYFELPCLHGIQALGAASREQPAW